MLMAAESGEDISQMLKDGVDVNCCDVRPPRPDDLRSASPLTTHNLERTRTCLWGIDRLCACRGSGRCNGRPPLPGLSLCKCSSSGTTHRAFTLACVPCSQLSLLSRACVPFVAPRRVDRLDVCRLLRRRRLREAAARTPRHRCQPAGRTQGSRAGSARLSLH